MSTEEKHIHPRNGCDSKYVQQNTQCIIIYIHYIYDQYKHMLFNIILFLTICKIKCSAFKTGMKHLIHVLCQTFAYKNWLLYLIVLTPHTVSLHVMSNFIPILKWIK